MRFYCIKNYLCFNNYPKNIIIKHINKRIIELNERITKPRINIDIDNKEKDKTITIPFCGIISENLKRVSNKYQINTIYRINSKLYKFIRLGKDPVSSLDKNNVVYKFNFKCGKTYVGQTKRPLLIRIEEHKNNIKLNPKYHSVITKHILENKNDISSHEILWNDFKIVHQENNFQKRAFAEMVFIKKEKNNSLNKVSDLEYFKQSSNSILEFLL